MTRVASLVLVAACSSTAPRREPSEVPRNTARATEDDACALIAAILAVPEYQTFYNGITCGESRPKRLVKIDAHPDVVPSDTTCPSYAFQLFHGERDVKGAALQIGVQPDGSEFRYSAQYIQPNLTELPDGTFESTNYYCFVAGSLEQRNGRWIAHPYKHKR